MFSLNLSQKSIQKFIRTYAKNDNWHNLDIETGNLGYGLIHYSLIRNLKPERILCIGSRFGLIPAICALACKDNSYGLVDFVDAGFDQTKEEPNHWGGLGVWKNINPDTYFKPFGLSPFINLYVQTSADFAYQNNSSSWGYIHIDGDHSYKGVKTDFNNFWPHLTSPGIMAIHDIYTQKLGGLDYGVNKLWQQLKIKYPSIEFPGECGLGIIQK